mmetsp:Transcript_53625/g.100622  ORF Transcript_53625/g.100622 Transcript_53625/m.100622 type:complete len:200 (+) Transcript_53625:350-949(+)
MPKTSAERADHRKWMRFKAPRSPARALCTAQRSVFIIGVTPMPPATRRTRGTVWRSMCGPYGPWMFMTTSRGLSAMLASLCSCPVNVPWPMFLMCMVVTPSSGEELMENGCHSPKEISGKLTSRYIPGEWMRVSPGHVNPTLVIFSGTLREGCPGLSSVQQSTVMGDSSWMLTSSAAFRKRSTRSSIHKLTPGSTKYHE